MSSVDISLPQHTTVAGEDGTRSVSSAELTDRAVTSTPGSTVATDTVDPRIAGLTAPRRVYPRLRRRSVDLTLRTLGPLLVLLVWWYASHTHLINSEVAAGPGEVASAFWTMLKNGELWSNLSASLKLAFSGLLIGVSAGLLIGLVTGLTRLGDELIDPVLQMVRTIPFIALSPLFVMWFGVGNFPKILLIALAAAFPVYLNTHSGVHKADRKILEAARVYGVSPLRAVWEIVIPEALPQLLVGLRMALTISLLALVFAEQVNTTKGIGYLLTSAESDFETNIMFVCVAIYAVWGLSADLIVRFLQWLLMPWQRASRTVQAGPSK